MNVFTTIPEQPRTRKEGQLTDAQLKEFFENGFVQVNDLFDSSDIEPVKKDTEGMVDEVAQKLFKAGKIKNLHEDADVFHRLTLLNQEFPNATVLLHKIGRVPPAYAKLWSHRKLLNIMEQLVGEDITGNPVWNIRPKTPNNQQHDVPWHQDNAYMDSTVDNVLIVTAWIPMLDTNENNGCLQFLTGGHKTGKLGKHNGCWQDTWYIDLDESDISKTLNVDPVKDVVTCRVPYGGAVFFTNLTPHRSLPNMSDVIRWSVDLRWQNAHTSMGFHGLKDGIVLRLKDQPNFVPDWETFNSVNRHDKQKAVENANISWHSKESDGDDYFETTMSGPWMLRWPITHPNRHTAKLAKSTA